jgi:hypothetical protein
MIGSNASLTPSKSQFGGLPVATLQPAPKPTAPQQSPWVQKPQYIDMNTTEDVVNNSLARGYQAGDSRYNIKQTDRAGLSRGKGAQYIANQGGAQAIAEANSQAFKSRMDDQKANAGMRSAYEQQMEQERQNQMMNQHTMDQSDWARRFAQQQAAFQAVNSMSGQRGWWLNNLLS